MEATLTTPGGARVVDVKVEGPDEVLVTMEADRMDLVLHGDAKVAAIQKGASHGLFRAGLSGPTVGPYPVKADGTMVEHPQAVRPGEPLRYRCQYRVRAGI